jgi:hypothetical protein
MQYQLIKTEDWSTVTVTVGGKTYTATDTSHENFDYIVEVLRNPDLWSDEEIVGLFDLSVAVDNKFSAISNRVTVSGGQVYLDGEAIDNSLTGQIVSFLNDGLDFTPLVNFFVKIMDNPNAHSREHLFQWLTSAKFAIAPDGDFIGYKGVNSDLSSVTAGPGIVNGVEANGHLDNSIGNVVEMDRAKVTFDPNVHCSVGLHVGNWGYASAFGSKTLEVRVNPADVVSVPNDHGYAKMRVSKYKVVRLVDAPYEKVLVL